jgi:hypothetical protein
MNGGDAALIEIGTILDEGLIWDKKEGMGSGLQYLIKCVNWPTWQENQESITQQHFTM